MILVISNDQEQSTSDVIEWLSYYNVQFVLISECNRISTINYSFENNERNIFLETTNGVTVDFKKISSYWYRRGMFSVDNNFLNECEQYILQHENREWGRVNELLMNALKTKKGIGNFYINDTNKNEVLIKAAELGLKIPDFLITNQKQDVLDFFKNERIINKTISNVMSISHDSKNYINRTVEINKESLSNAFNTSLFQTLIDKKYELRIFYIDNSFYASAIFSQGNEKTRIDFRNYDYKKPNRTVPFILPAEIEKKLLMLMKELSIDTGSIDIMVSNNNEYYFLEVNPVGQFGMVSYPCNYYCEKRIAETLIN